jgi:hypothetical protein
MDKGVKIEKAGEGNRTLMTSLEGCSSIYRWLQISHFLGFYDGVNSNRTGIRQEMGTGNSSEKDECDAQLTPENEIWIRWNSCER